MKRPFLSIALALLSGGTVFAAQAQPPQPPQQQSQSNVITVAFSDPARPGTLNVRLTMGSITVRAYAGRDVRIRTTERDFKPSVRSTASATAETETQGLRRIDTAVNGILVEEENNVMTISDRNRFNFLNLSAIEIDVPVRTNLKLNSTNGGGILVEGVEGDIEATHQNGKVTLTDVSGSVVAHSQNGGVVAKLKAVTPDKPMAFTSVNGNVDVTLPSTLKANIRARSNNGGIYTDFDNIQLNSPAATPAADNSAGRAERGRIEQDRTVTGTINGGGPDFELRTVNGNVFIRKQK